MLLNINIFNQNRHKSVIEMDVTEDFLVGVINYNDSTIENLLLFRAVANQEMIIWGLIGVNQEFSIGAIKWMDIKPSLTMSINKAKKLGLKPFTFNYDPATIENYSIQYSWLLDHNLDQLMPPNYEYILPISIFNALVNSDPNSVEYKQALINIGIFYNEAL